MSRLPLLSKVIILAIAGAVCAPPTPALYAQSASHLKHVSLDAGHFSFSVPSDFHALTVAEIKRKFPSGNPPKYVYANQSQSISIAVNFIGRVPSLPVAKSIFDKMLPEKAPKFHWIKDGYSTINGTTWIDLEFTTAARDTTIHNNELYALLPNTGVGVNLNTTVKSYPKAAPLFQAVKSSLTLSP